MFSKIIIPLYLLPSVQQCSNSTSSPTCSLLILVILGTSQAVQWLTFCASTAGGMGSIPGWGTKILHAARYSQKKKKVILVIQMCLQWYLVMVLICISLKANNFDHIFMCLPAICISFSLKYLFKSFAHSNDVFVSLILSY